MVDIRNAVDKGSCFPQDIEILVWYSVRSVLSHVDEVPLDGVTIKVPYGIDVFKY